MNKYFYLFCILFSVISFDTLSQYGYYKDVLKFSHSFRGGSARIQSIGGASTSLGGDISSITLNPAGLGFFNKKNFSISYNNISLKSNSTYLGEKSDIKSNFDRIDNLSVVFPIKRSVGLFNSRINDCLDCPKFNLGISYSVVKDFSNERLYQGYNDNNSILDYFLNDAQGVPLSQISNSQPISGIGLLQEAYDHYLINPDQDLPGTYFSFIGGFPLQREEIYNSGKISKFSISSGTNIKDKFYLGFGVNIYSVGYNQERIYSENQFELVNESGEWEFEGILDYLILKDFFKISGAGASFSAGLIFKPLDELNFGINYESKTKYSLKEELFNELETKYFDYYFEPEDTVLGNSISGTATNVADYRFTSPSKISIGSSYFFKKYGFISADIDLINYSSSNVESYDFNPFQDNSEINSLYKSLSVNYRFGIEGRYENFYLRLGYNFLADPSRDLINSGIKNNLIKKSFGVGYLSNTFSLDIAYINLDKNSKISPYPIYINQPVADFSSNYRSILLTLGIRINNR